MSDDLMCPDCGTKLTVTGSTFELPRSARQSDGRMVMQTVCGNLSCERQAIDVEVPHGDS